MSNRITEIRERLAAVAGPAWKYNPKHEMFIGATNAVEMHDRVLDLGRDGKEYYPYRDETGSGYRITEASKRHYDRTVALGEFLEHCREDIEFLLRAVQTTPVWSGGRKL